MRLKHGRFLLIVAMTALTWGCSGMPEAASERPVDEASLAVLQPGMEEAELLQRLGPPAMRSGYPNLNETVVSWRLVEVGNRRMFFNAHLDPSHHVRYYSRTPDWATLGRSRG